MKLIVIIIFICIGYFNAFCQIIDSFSDGDYTSNPAWGGDTGSWLIVTDSDVSTGATNSNTLRLNFGTAISDVQYLSTQRTASWGTAQSWGFWMGRRAQPATVANHSIVWLWANESDLESSTIDGYRIRFGDNSGDDEIVLQRVDDGVVSDILSSSGAVPNALTDIGFLVRITRTNTSQWTIFTSTLPTSDGTGAVASDIPSQTNTSINQGNVTDATYTDFSNGYFGLMAVHSSTGDPRTGAEFDQLYFATSSDAPLPISLTSFTASAGNNRVTLKWVTASEQENMGFKIMRSTDQQGNYSLLSSYDTNPELEGQFNSNVQTKYKFVDQTVDNDVTYWYKLVDVDVNGVHTDHGPMSATPHAVGGDITTINITPAGSFTLHPNYPNPFNPITTLRFDIPALSGGESTVEMTIYNSQGQKVKTLFKGILTPGTHELSWESDSDTGVPVSSGMYYAVLKMENLVRTSKMLLIK